METEEVTHVVTDDSGDPEHIDDCPGCEAFTLTGHRASQSSAVEPATGFYVTVRHGARSGALLGPYGSHDEALANVDRAREYAEQVNDRAVWYAYGTAKVTAKPGRTLPVGTFNDTIGLTAG